LPELVAKSEDEYLDIASGLASDFEWLTALSAGLRDRMRRSPLTDAAGVTREIEDAYRTMWKEWCRA
jgi:predicted O-linked N-acetylglucosamine transferase (SPINDLY family)